MFQEIIPKVGKHKSELGAKTSFRVEFVEIEILTRNFIKYWCYPMQCTVLNFYKDFRGGKLFLWCFFRVVRAIHALLRRIYTYQIFVI